MYVYMLKHYVYTMYIYTYIYIYDSVPLNWRNIGFRVDLPFFWFLTVQLMGFVILCRVPEVL